MIDSFLVRIAGRVCEIRPGSTRLGSLLVLERLPAKVLSCGDIKALYRLQCELCGKIVTRDLTRSAPKCSCPVTAEQQLEVRVLNLLNTSRKPFVSFRAMKQKLSLSEDKPLQVALKRLVMSGRIQTRRDKHSRGFCLAAMTSGKRSSMEAHDDCSYDSATLQ
jgi:hypothetical protein